MLVLLKCIWDLKIPFVRKGVILYLKIPFVRKGNLQASSLILILIRFPVSPLQRLLFNLEWYHGSWEWYHGSQWRMHSFCESPV